MTASRLTRAELILWLLESIVPPAAYDNTDEQSAMGILNGLAVLKNLEDRISH